MRKFLLLALIVLSCISLDAKKTQGSQQRRSNTSKTTATVKKSTKSTKSEAASKPETPEEDLFDYTSVLAKQVPTVNYVLQAKKDPVTQKYGYENTGEKQYWWAEAHKLGKKKEELNNEQKIQWVISPQYDKVSKHFSEGLGAVEINGKVGFIDQFNRFIIEPQFEPMDDMESFQYGLAVVKKDGKYGFINKQGEFVIQPEFDKAENFGDDLLAVVKQNNKFGCIDLHGEIVVPCTFLAKEIMTTVPIKNKPYKKSQKDVKAKLEEGHYSEIIDKILASDDYATNRIEDLKLMPLSGNTPPQRKGEVSALEDGFYLWNDGKALGIIDSYGRVILQPDFKTIKYQPGEKVFIVEESSHGDGKPAFGIINRSGGWIIPPVFEKLDNFKRGIAVGSVGEYSTNVDINGLVESSFIEQMLKASSEEKGTYYTQRLIGIWPTCAPAHNNMGIYYASTQDDLKHAINHFTVAHRLDPDNEDFKNNMKSAKSERNSRRWNRVLTGLQIAGAVLTIGAMTYSAVSGNTVMTTSDFTSAGAFALGDGSGFSSESNYGGNSTSAAESSKSKGGLSEETYREQYRRWERNAKSCYDSLTLLGVKVKKNGKDTSGSAMGSWGAGNYMGMKKNLRYAQKEMKKVRREAQRYGYSIPASEYEDVTVSF